MRPANQNDFKVGTTYTFDVYGPSILGDQFQNLKLASIEDFEKAFLQDDVVSRHNLMMSSLDPSVSRDPTTLIYGIFRNSAGKSIVLALDWIDGESVITVTNFIIDLVVNLSKPEDKARLINALDREGFEFSWTERRQVG